MPWARGPRGARGGRAAQGGAQENNGNTASGTNIGEPVKACNGEIDVTDPGQCWAQLGVPQG